MTETGHGRARGAMTMALFWAAFIVFLVALGALAYLGADLIWWVVAVVVVLGLLGLGRLAAPPGFTEAQAAKQPDRRILPRLLAFFLLVIIVAGVLGYLGAARG